LKTGILDSDDSNKRRAYSIAEAAAMLGIHRVTMHRLVVAGKLKPIAGFGRMKISAADLDRFLNETSEYEPKRKGRN
jgi:excisionase family DNA binding protein